MTSFIVVYFMLLYCKCQKVSGNKCMLAARSRLIIVKLSKLCLHRSLMSSSLSLHVSRGYTWFGLFSREDQVTCQHARNAWNLLLFMHPKVGWDIGLEVKGNLSRHSGKD